MSKGCLEPFGNLFQLIFQKLVSQSSPSPWSEHLSNVNRTTEEVVGSIPGSSVSDSDIRLSYPMFTTTTDTQISSELYGFIFR